MGPSHHYIKAMIKSGQEESTKEVHNNFREGVRDKKSPCVMV